MILKAEIPESLANAIIRAYHEMTKHRAHGNKCDWIDLRNQNLAILAIFASPGRYYHHDRTPNR